ncbi:MAG: hypothetical protein JSS49_08180 [Planctomycetes bacterium]|nr:hypothetical protein [Planctomycetota bacterium]
MSSNGHELPIPYRVDNAIDPSLSDYVGSDACRDCHSEIWEKYQSHPMAKSFAKVEHASPIEDYTKQLSFAPPGNRRYRVEVSADGIRHHEIMVDSAGEVIYDQSFPVAYVLGSGKRGRGYVIDHDGLLFKSSISWYSDTRKWGLSPDYLPESHMRFERRVTGGCLTCHSGLPNFTRGEPDRFKVPAFLEEAIGCERCHGPGREHVALQNSGESAHDPIVNPRRLDMDRREAICAQCHLRGETRILRTGRTPHDFRPGERLEDNWIVFVKSHGPGITRSGRAATQAEHMVSSTCFQRSEGRMGCTSCHDPHSLPETAVKDEYFRQKCLTCHADRGCSLPKSKRDAAPYLDRCTNCHMPSISAENVLHRSVADHRILREPVAAEEDVEPLKSKIFQFASTPIPEYEIERAKALKMASDASEFPDQSDLAQSAATRLKQLIAKAPEDVELYIALGNCEILQDRPREAERWWTKVLQLNPRHEQTIQALAALYHDNFQLVPAERMLKRFIAMNPWHASYYGRLAGTLMHRGDAAGAIAAAERGLELNPSLWKLHGFVADVYTKVGDRAAALRHQQLLARERPADAPAEGTEVREQPE